MYPEKKGGSHKMARPQQNWGLLTLLTRWASIWTMPNTASPKSEPPCGRAVYTPRESHHFRPPTTEDCPRGGPGDKPLSEPIMVRLPTHICVTRPQWVNRFRPVENIFNHILLNTFDHLIQTSQISFPKGPLSTFSISQHCFMWWLGAWWQQTITWTIVDQDVWHHMASLGHNRFNPFNAQSTFGNMKNMFILKSPRSLTVSSASRSQSGCVLHQVILSTPSLFFHDNPASHSQDTIWPWKFKVKGTPFSTAPSWLISLVFGIRASYRLPSLSTITSTQVPRFRKWRRESVAHMTYLPLAGGQQH